MAEPAEIEAFEPVIVQHVPAVTQYQGETYHSDHAYTDRNGDVWRYYGLYDGASMWQRDGHPTAAWNITRVADQRGPLKHTEAAS